MCLVVTPISGVTEEEKLKSVIKIAESDILVYKRLGVSAIDGTLRSPMMSECVWTVNKLKKVRKFTTEFSSLSNFLSISEGIHAYVGKTCASRNWRGKVTKTMVIPKGTKYIVSDDRREVVALAMKLYEAPKELKIKKGKKKK